MRMLPLHKWFATAKVTNRMLQEAAKMCDDKDDDVRYYSVAYLRGYMQSIRDQMGDGGTMIIEEEDANTALLNLYNIIRHLQPESETANYVNTKPVCEVCGQPVSKVVCGSCKSSGL